MKQWAGVAGFKSRAGSYNSNSQNTEMSGSYPPVQNQSQRHL